MADPRDTAHTWLAEQICASAVEAGGRALEPPCGSCRRRADAILNAPGVEVLGEQGRFLPTGSIWHQADDGDQMRPVIRLPARPIEDPP